MQFVRHSYESLQVLTRCKYTSGCCCEPDKVIFPMSVLLQRPEEELLARARSLDELQYPSPGSSPAQQKARSCAPPREPCVSWTEDTMFDAQTFKWEGRRPGRAKFPERQPEADMFEFAAEVSDPKAFWTSMAEELSRLDLEVLRLT